MKNGSSFSLSFILSFLLKMVEEEGRKILSLLSLSLSLLNTTSARSKRDEVRRDEALERRSASGLSLEKEQIRTGEGLSLSLLLSLLFFSLSRGKKKKLCEGYASSRDVFFPFLFRVLQ